MTQTVIYIILAFLGGCFVMGMGGLVLLMKMRKSLRSTQGFLESEKLMKERLSKENKQLHELKDLTRHEVEAKIQELEMINKGLHEDILLLQRSNEETEALFKAGEPVIHSLKIRLIEAQNTIARYKSQVGVNV